MNIKLEKKDIGEMIEKYYQEILGIEGEVSITCSKQLVGYGTAEHDDCFVNFKLKGEMTILGSKRSIEIDISEEEVMASIRYYIEKEGYIYTGYRMLKGMEPRTSGYGPHEKTNYIPYFNGIEIGVTNEKLKELSKRRGEMK